MTIGNAFRCNFQEEVLLKWHTKFQTNAFHAEHVPLNVPLALFLKATENMLSTKQLAFLAVLAQVLVLLALPLKRN